MRKKIISLLLAVGILATFSVAFAAEPVSEDSQITQPVLSSKAINTISEIPIYITYIRADAEDNTEIAMETALNSVNENVAAEEKNSVMGFGAKRVVDANTVICEEDEYEIVRVSDGEKKEMFSSPLYTSTFARVQSVLDEGTTVTYINFFLSEAIDSISANGIMATAAADPSDPAYWEANCTYLNTYNGYKFLYLESAFGVETSEVTPGNLTSSMNWTDIAKKTVELLLDHYVKGAWYNTVSTATDVLSTVFGAYSPPVSVTYGASTGYVKAKVSGDIYMRTVLISDNLNKVQGYAYYNWGTTERFVAAVRTNIKYPYLRNASGTYEYNYISGTSSRKTTYTPGYYGNTTLYQSIITLYSGVGYFTHDEQINTYGVIAKLLG